MRKPLKYGIIAAGTIFVAAIVVAILYLEPSRLPTVATPAGVVVPAGMRYVGGDEFDQPDGSMPDAKRWITHANLTPENREVWIENGVLAMSPNGTSKSNYIMILYHLNLEGGIPGRIEIRSRMSTIDGILRRIKKNAGSPGYGLNVGTARIYPATHGDYAINFFNIGYENGIERTKEDTGGIPIENTKPGTGYDGAYHTYAIAWRGTSVTCFRDGIEVPHPGRTQFLYRPVLSPAGIKRLEFLPAFILEPLKKWTTWGFAQPHRLNFTCSDLPPIDTSDRLRLEIDYVRIFQE